MGVYQGILFSHRMQLRRARERIFEFIPELVWVIARVCARIVSELRIDILIILGDPGVNVDLHAMIQNERLAHDDDRTQ